MYIAPFVIVSPIQLKISVVIYERSTPRRQEKRVATCEDARGNQNVIHPINERIGGQLTGTPFLSQQKADPSFGHMEAGMNAPAAKDFQDTTCRIVAYSTPLRAFISRTGTIGQAVARQLWRDNRMIFPLHACSSPSLDALTASARAFKRLICDDRTQPVSIIRQ